MGLNPDSIHWTSSSPHLFKHIEDFIWLCFWPPCCWSYAIIVVEEQRLWIGFMGCFKSFAQVVVNLAPWALLDEFVLVVRDCLVHYIPCKCFLTNMRYYFLDILDHVLLELPSWGFSLHEIRKELVRRPDQVMPSYSHWMRLSERDHIIAHSEIIFGVALPNRLHLASTFCCYQVVLLDCHLPVGVVGLEVPVVDCRSNINSRPTRCLP